MASALRKFHQKLGHHATGQIGVQSQFVLLEGWSMKPKKREEVK